MRAELPQPMAEALGVDGPVPVETLRRALLESPQLFMKLVLGFDLQPFQEACLLWCLRHHDPASGPEAPE